MGYYIAYIKFNNGTEEKFTCIDTEIKDNCLFIRTSDSRNKTVIPLTSVLYYKVNYTW